MFSDFKLAGAIANALLVILGGALGLLLKKLLGSKQGPKSQAVSDAIFKGLGLCVMVIGICGAIKTQQILVVILSIVIGAIIGTLIDLDKWINVLGDKIQSLTKGKLGNVAEGFVNASLLFCVGAMTILGPLESGLSGDHSTQFTKGIIDCVSAVIFASTMGVGVLFSSALILIIQGTLTLLAVWVAPVLSDTVITEMTATGSLLLIGLSLNMIGLTKFKVMNYVPAIFLPIGLVPLFNWLTSLL